MRTQKFPCLYDCNSRGKVKFWSIEVIEKANGEAVYTMEWGQMCGKGQKKDVVIKEGKNLGKSNETTPFEQACADAQSKYNKKLDNGYLSEEIMAIATKNCTIMSTSTRPMLAHKYEDYKYKVTFPAFTQPKLDGCRALAVFNHDGFVDLISRQGKSFGEPVKHIYSVLKALPLKNIILDGELYNHDLEFQTTISLIKRLQSDSSKIEYHLYDCIDKSSLTFIDRLDLLNKSVTPNDVLKLVETTKVDSETEMMLQHTEFTNKGYEGLILRHGNCIYKDGFRSSDLLKVKEFLEYEFKIVDVLECEKLPGQAVFVCETIDGNRFNCRPKGTDEERQKFWLDKADYYGKMLTVRFFEWTTGENPVPRFPVGLCARDYE